MADRFLEIGRRVRHAECVGLTSEGILRLPSAVTEAIRTAGGRHIDAVRVLVQLGLAEDTIEADELIRELEG